MKNFLKNKLNLFSMNKSFMFMMIFLIIGTVSVFGQSQHQILRYQFEEGSGNIIIDSSGNNNNGIQNSCSWSTNRPFGAYSLNFDGSNDYVSVLQSTDTPTWFFTSFWLDADVGAVEETIFNVKGTIENYKVYIDYADGTDYIKLDYIDGLQTLRTIDLTSEPTIVGWNHYVVGINDADDIICFWKNAVQTCLENATGGIYTDEDTKQLLIGRDFDGIYNDLDANVDEFRVFDFMLNESQISDLYNNNHINLVEIEEPEEEQETQYGDLIVDFTPKTNDTITIFDNFQVNTNILTDCTLYINNNEIEISTNKISHIVNYPELEFGENSFFWYCEHVSENNTKTFDILKTQFINVSEGSPQDVSFRLIGNDFNVNDFDLWITTPCLNAGAHGVGMLPFRPEYNLDGAIFKKVENGIVNFNLTPEKYEFCLYNARFIISGEGKTTNYDIVEHYGDLELGTLDIPNNVTTSFNVALDVFDVYDKQDPKAWGQTWTTIIGGLILLVLGTIVLISGIATNNGKITFAGAFLVMSALGIEFVGMVGLLL